jgi:multimeric flavodoxin WrbA
MSRILVINSSPRENGNSETLADALIKGVRDVGNIGEKLNLRELTINSCLGCIGSHGSMGIDNPCVQNDDMRHIYDAVSKADTVVLASPLYWMFFNSPMKTMLDRLSALAPKVTHKDTALIIAATREDDFIFSMAIPYFETCIAGNLKWAIKGIVKAGGLSDVGDAEKSDHVRQAYELGKSL